MKNLETGKDKVKKICEVLRKETLEPARIEAEEVVSIAKKQAEEIFLDAKNKAEKMVEEARLEIEKQRGIFQASLAQACRQALEVLKEKVEKKLFNPELKKLIAQSTREPKILSQLITTVIKAIEKEGIEADLSVYIPSVIPPEEINRLLALSIIDRLKEKGVLLSPNSGGIEVKIVQENITVDLSEGALEEIVAGYIRKDFRKLVFGI